MTALAGIKLYELADARDILDEWLAESEGEVTPELQQLLDQLQGDANEKIERVALYVREQLATADAIDAEAERLKTRAAVLRKAAEGLKAYLKLQLERLGVAKVTGLLATIAVQRNSQPSIKAVLEARELWAIEDVRPFVTREETVLYALDRVAILAAWKAGQPLPSTIGVELGSHVRIR